MQVGEDFNAGDALWLEAVLTYAGEQFTPRLVIGPHARLSDNVHIACLDRVTIGPHLLCGSRVLIADHAHGEYGDGGGSDPEVPPAQRPLRSAGPVVIGKNVWLGDGVAVLPGAVIGDGCILGANAVVTGNIPPRTIAVGSPAKPVRRWDTETRTWRRLPPGRGSDLTGATW
jgi:lipopolysaccharide O-acetyltransferase